MTLLPIHIIAGSIAIVAGFISVFAVYGLKLHRNSGMIFVYSLALGRVVARYAVERERRGGLNAWRTARVVAH